jgi:hypothetical protein
LIGPGDRETLPGLGSASGNPENLLSFGSIELWSKPQAGRAITLPITIADTVLVSRATRHDQP